MYIWSVSLQNSCNFSFSDFRGLVPAPVINGLHYFTALELQKSVDLSEASFKTPFGSYSSEKR